MTKNTAAWGALVPVTFLGWALLMRVVFVLAGYNPGDYTGVRGYIMVVTAMVGTLITLIVAHENAPHTRDSP
jgi:hypothetical protein